jgi:hypothetical protein
MTALLAGLAVSNGHLQDAWVKLRALAQRH